MKTETVSFSPKCGLVANEVGCCLDTSWELTDYVPLNNHQFAILRKTPAWFTNHSGRLQPSQTYEKLIASYATRRRRTTTWCKCIYVAWHWWLNQNISQLWVSSKHFTNAQDISMLFDGQMFASIVHLPSHISTHECYALHTENSKAWRYWIRSPCRSD